MTESTELWVATLVIGIALFGLVLLLYSGLKRQISDESANISQRLLAVEGQCKKNGAKIRTIDEAMVYRFARLENKTDRLIDLFAVCEQRLAVIENKKLSRKITLTSKGD